MGKCLSKASNGEEEADQIAMAEIKEDINNKIREINAKLDKLETISDALKDIKASIERQAVVEEDAIPAVEDEAGQDAAGADQLLGAEAGAGAGQAAAAAAG